MERVISVFPGAAVEAPEQEGIDKFSEDDLCFRIEKIKNCKMKQFVVNQ